MSDIVDEMCAAADWFKQPPPPSDPPPIKPLDRMLREAADEIERLRAASADLATENERLRRWLQRGAFWMNSEHAREWWAHNEVFQEDRRAISRVLEPPTH